MVDPSRNQPSSAPLPPLGKEGVKSVTTRYVTPPRPRTPPPRQPHTCGRMTQRERCWGRRDLGPCVGQRRVYIGVSVRTLMSTTITKATHFIHTTTSNQPKPTQPTNPTNQNGSLQLLLLQVRW